MAPYRILRQGYMHKEPPPSKRGLRKKLHRYWFVLVEDDQQIALVYFKCEDDFLLRRRNEGVVRVDNAFAISVVGEYMGCKNALSVKTPRNEYFLVAESRYEIHEWLYTLHNALEAFRKKHRRPRQSRRRANTIHGSGGASASAKTPPPTPSRKAPPPPSSSSSSNDKPRRKPVRPAPAAPPIRRQSSADTPATAPSPATSTSNSHTPPFDVDPFLSQETPPEAMLSYERHQTVDMEFLQGEEGHAPLAMRERCSSDSEVLRERTRSLPDLMDPDIINPQQKVVSPSDIPGLHSPPKTTGHTRHLSLTNTEADNKNHFGMKKKRSTRRHGSLKHRSRSPPELPPPPPPPEGHEEGEGNPPSSQVMNTINSIDTQLERMNGSQFDSTPQQPTIPAPQRSPFSYTRTSPVPEQPVEEEKGLAAESGEEGRVSPEGAHALAEEPLAADLELQQERPDSNGVANGSLNRKKQVMFKEEVEDIPMNFETPPLNSYEPRIDYEFNSPPLEPPVVGGGGGENHEDLTPQQLGLHPESGVDEDIPRSVAALKRMLFGGGDDNVQRYPKEGSLSPRYTHPENFMFDESYNFARDVAPPANHNNNNVQENLYDQPWEHKTVAKYKVVGVRHHGKDYPPSSSSTKLQFGQVLAVDTPVPGSTELCSVTSLEQAKKEESDSSLLSSINSTLKAFSRYGSDSLLLRRSQAAKEGGGAKEDVHSTRRELEKIRAAHKREDFEINGQARMALSLDDIDDTQVSFDSSAQAHVYRSLV